METLDVRTRAQFRRWLEIHHDTARECWVPLRRGEPAGEGLWYLDAVEEALCFGWIDSTARAGEGVRLQRFTPRKIGGHWMELNKARVRRLERLGLMTDAGRAVLPEMDVRAFRMDGEIASALKKARAYARFRRFPPLYQRIRVSNVLFYRGRNPQAFARALTHLVESAKAGAMYGEWNDYGRLDGEE